MRRPHTVSGESSNLQMAPLIDVVFLMLSYFLFTLSLGMLEGVLPSKLALGEEQSEQQQEEETQQVFVRLVRSGDRVQYYLDDWPLTGFEQLTQRLETLSKDTMVVMSAGPTVATAPVVRTYNQCLKLGLKKIVFPVAS